MAGTAGRGGGNTSYNLGRRLQAARAAEFSIVSTYKYGYRNREDITNLPSGVLIVGSKNVLTNVSERVQIRQGYIVDGPSSSVNAPILGTFDWLTRNNAEVHLRSGFLTSSSSAKVQYRYDDGSGTIQWRDLITGLDSSSFNFTGFWKPSETLRVALGVNGDGNIYEWNGAVATINTSTSSSITINGTDSWESAGFYASTSPRIIVVGGTPFTYTGGEQTLTITGVTPDASGIAANAIGHQQYIVTAASTFVAVASAYVPTLISTLGNQIYLGSETNPVIYLSKVDSYTDYSSSSPRQPQEGSSFILDENIVAFVVQGVTNPSTPATMYFSAGKSLWYQTTFTAGTDSTGNPYESTGAAPIKVGPLQGAISQAGVSNMKNNVIAITNETTIDVMGVLESFFTATQTSNISDPIKLDIDSYDFTDASIFYYRYYIYVAVPKEGLVLQYNLTSKTWDAPMTIPISRFYIVDGQLYGHSYNTSESYQLFTGYADRVYPGFTGYSIPATMAFSYETYGSRHTLKKANALFVEGYISTNTQLTASVIRELDGCATMASMILDGSDKQFVCIPSETGSLGADSLGKQKLGGGTTASIQGLPPSFLWEPTFSNVDFHKAAVTFSFNGVNQQMQLIAFGLNASQSPQESVSIRD